MNASSRAKARYNKAHYDAICFNAEKGTKQALKEASELENISVSKLICNSIVYYIGNVVLPKHISAELLPNLGKQQREYSSCFSSSPTALAGSQGKHFAPTTATHKQA